MNHSNRRSFLLLHCYLYVLTAEHRRWSSLDNEDVRSTSMDAFRGSH